MNAPCAGNVFRWRVRSLCALAFLCRRYKKACMINNSTAVVTPLRVQHASEESLLYDAMYDADFAALLFEFVHRVC